MKIGIVCDNWKLPRFEKALKQGLYFYEKCEFTKDTTTILVDIDQSRFEELQQLVRDCETQSQEQKRRKN